MTLTDVYFHDWTLLVLNEIRKPLVVLVDRCGGVRKAARELGWQISDVTKLLRLEPLEPLAGRSILELTEQDLQQRSFKRLKLLLRCAIVKSLEDAGPNLPSIAMQRPSTKGDEKANRRAIARFLDVRDCVVRRTMARPEYGLCTARRDRQ